MSVLRSPHHIESLDHELALFHNIVINHGQVTRSAHINGFYPVSWLKWFAFLCITNKETMP